jgi:hypothetical protein
LPAPPYSDGKRAADEGQDEAPKMDVSIKAPLEASDGAEPITDAVLEIAARFSGGPDAPALSCPEVLVAGMPILCVVRKNNIWQFLCGRDHSAEHVYGYDAPLVRTVREMVALDPTIAAVATMNDRHILRRRSVSERWEPEDDLSFWWF